MTTNTLPVDEEKKQLEQTVIRQQEVINELRAKMDECCPEPKCPEPPSPPPKAECDIEYLKHVYAQATCDRNEMESCIKALQHPAMAAKFCALKPGGEQLYIDLLELADIELAILCMCEAEAWFDYLCCIAQHKAECQQKLCESIVATAECVEKLDPQCRQFVQKITGKCINS